MSSLRLLALRTMTPVIGRGLQSVTVSTTKQPISTLERQGAPVSHENIVLYLGIYLKGDIPQAYLACYADMADRPVLSFYGFHNWGILPAGGSTLDKNVCKMCYFHFAYYFEVLFPMKSYLSLWVPEYYVFFCCFFLVLFRCQLIRCFQALSIKERPCMYFL